MKLAAVTGSYTDLCGSVTLEVEYDSLPDSGLVSFDDVDTLIFNTADQSLNFQAFTITYYAKNTYERILVNSVRAKYMNCHN